MDTFTNFENTFPQGETTFGEYATTSSINRFQSNFAPSSDEIQNENIDLNAYQTSSNNYSGNYIQSYSSNEENSQFAEYQTTNSSSYENLSGGDNLDTNYATPIESNDYQISEQNINNEAQYGEFNVDETSGGNYEGFNDTYDQSNTDYQVELGNTNTYYPESNNVDYQTEVNLENFGNEAQFGEYQVTSSAVGEQFANTASYDMPTSYSNSYETNEQVGSSYDVNEYQSSQITSNNYYGESANMGAFEGNYSVSTPDFETNENVDFGGYNMNEPTFESTVQTAEYEKSTPTMDYQTNGDVLGETASYNADEGYQVNEPIVESTPSFEYGDYNTSAPIESAGYQETEATYNESIPIESTGYQATETTYNESIPIESAGYQATKTNFENNFNLDYQSEPYQGESTSLYQNYEASDFKTMEQVDTTSTLNTNLYTENIQNFETNVNEGTYEQHQSVHPLDAFLDLKTFETYQPNETFNTETNEYQGEYQASSPIVEDIPSFDAIATTQTYNNEYQDSNPTFEVDTTAFNTQTYETYNVDSNVQSFDMNSYTPSEPIIENTENNYNTEAYQVTEQTNVNYEYNDTSNVEYGQPVDYNTSFQNEQNENYNEYSTSEPTIDTTSTLQNYDTNSFQNFETGIDTTSTINTTEAYMNSTPSFETTPVYENEISTTYQNNEILPLESTNQDYASSSSLDVTSYNQPDYQEYKATEQITEVNDFESTPIGLSNFETTNFETTNYEATNYESTNYVETPIESPTFEATNYEATNYETTQMESPTFDTTNYEETPIESPTFETTNYEATNYETTPIQSSTFETTNYETTNYETTQEESPAFETTNFEATNYETTPIESPTFETTNYEATNYETTQVESPAFETTNFETSNFETTNYATTNYETTPIESPTFETTNFQTTNYETTQVEAPAFETTNYETTPIELPTFETTNYETTKYESTPIELSTFETTKTTDFSTTNYETASIELPTFETTNYATTLFDDTKQTTEYNTNIDYTANIPSFETSSALQNYETYDNQVQEAPSTHYETSSQVSDGGFKFTDLNQNFDFGTINTTFNEYNTNVESKITEPILEINTSSYQTSSAFPANYNIKESPKETITTTTNNGLDLGLFETAPTFDTNATFVDYPTTSVSYDIKKTTPTVSTFSQVTSPIPVNIPKPIISSNLETGSTFGEYLTTKKANNIPTYTPPIDITSNYNQVTTQSITTKASQPITIKIPKIQKVYVPKIKKVYIPSKKKIYVTKHSSNNITNPTKIIDTSYNQQYSYVPKPKYSYVPKPKYSYVPKEHHSYVQKQKYSYVPNITTNSISNIKSSTPSISMVPIPVLKNVSSSISQVPKSQVIPSTSSIRIVSSNLPKTTISQVPIVQIPSVVKYKSYSGHSHGLGKPAYMASTYRPILRSNLPTFSNYAFGNKSYLMPKYVNKTYIARKL